MFAIRWSRPKPTLWAKFVEQVPLLAHIMALREADKTAIAAALSAAERAVAKAEQAAEKRFEGLNELRKVVTDVLSTLISRAEAEALFKGMGKDISTLTARVDRAEGSGSGKMQNWTAINGIIPWAIAAGALLLSIWRH